MTWQPTDWAAVEARNDRFILRCAAAGRRIYYADLGAGEVAYRIDNTAADDTDPDAFDTSEITDEVHNLIVNGLLRQVRPDLDAVISDAGRAYLAEVSR